MKVSMEMSGLADLKARLETMRDRTEEVIGAAMQGAAMVVQESAKRKVPVKSGNLKEAIKARTESDGDTYSGICYVDASLAKYGPYIEYGTGIYAEAGDGRKTGWAYENSDGAIVFTRGGKAQPFMRPAFEQDGQAGLDKAKALIMARLKL